MAQKSKLELILEMKDRLKTGITKAKEKFSKNVGGMKEAVTEFKNNSARSFATAKSQLKDKLGGMSGYMDKFKEGNLKAFSALKDEIPGASRAIELLSNKYVLMAAAVVGVVTAAVMLGSHLVQVTKEVSAVQSSVQMYFNQTGDTLRKTSAEVLGISRATGKSTEDIIKSANSLTKEYEDAGVKASDSLNAIKIGLVATQGQLDLDEIKEYSSQMKTAGVSMKEFIAFNVNALKQGVFSDKAPDTVKEFSLRIREMTPAAKDALKGIGLSSAAITKGLNDGSMSVMSVMKQVSGQMGKVNQQARQTAIADLFGGAGEDAGQKFLLSLAKMDLSLDSIRKNLTAQQQHQLKLITLNENVAAQQLRIADHIKPIIMWWEAAKLQVMELFYTVIAGAFDWFKTNGPLISDLIKGFAAAFLLVKASTIASMTVLIVQMAVAKVGMIASTLATLGFAGALNAVKVALLSIPIVGWILAGVAALITMYHKWDSFRHMVDGTFNVFKEFFPVIKALGQMIAAAFTFSPANIAKAMQNIRGAWEKFDITDAFNKGFDESAKQTELKRNKDKAKSPSAAINTDLTAEGDGENSEADKKRNLGGLDTSSPSAIEGRATQTRNITVNIESFAKNLNVVPPGGADSMTVEEVERIFNALMMRVTRNTENSLV